MLVRKRMSVIMLAAFAGIAFGSVSSAHAQIQEVQVEVKGLSCPFCVKGVEKHLKKIDGVEDVSTSLKKGRVTLHYKAGSPFDVANIEKAVVRGGFTPGEVELRANGLVSRENDEFVFAISGTPSSLVLHSSDSAKGHSAEETVSKKTGAKLDEAITAAQLLEIAGVVHEHKDARPGLSLERVKKVSVKD